jgi:hypothetical protein
MLTKNRLGRTRTIALTILAVSGLVGMTLQPVLARTPDVARPAAAALTELEVSALIDQLRVMIANLQALIEELENAPDAAPVPADEDDLDQDEDVDDGPANDVDESKEDDVNDASVDDVSVDEPDQESVDQPSQASVDAPDQASVDDESQD